MVCLPDGAVSTSEANLNLSAYVCVLACVLSQRLNQYKTVPGLHVILMQIRFKKGSLKDFDKV